MLLITINSDSVVGYEKKVPKRVIKLMKEVFVEDHGHITGKFKGSALI